MASDQKEKMDWKEQEKKLFKELRQAVAENKSVRDLVQMIYAAHGVKLFREALVMRSIKEAFDLGFHDVKEIAGAECVGNAVHSDEAIDRIMLPVLREALERSANSGS